MELVSGNREMVSGMNREVGLTLVELMVAMAIVAIVAVVGMPSVSSFMDRGKIDVSTTKMLRSIVVARSEAVTRNQPVVMCTSNNGESCTTSDWEDGWISYADENGDGGLDTGEPVVSVNGAVERVTLRSENGAVTFLPNGSVSATETFFTCGSDGDTTKAETIVITFTGRPRTISGADECP